MKIFHKKIGKPPIIIGVYPLRKPDNHRNAILRRFYGYSSGCQAHRGGFERLNHHSLTEVLEVNDGFQDKYRVGFVILWHFPFIRDSSYFLLKTPHPPFPYSAWPLPSFP